MITIDSIINDYGKPLKPIWKRGFKRIECLPKIQLCLKLAYKYNTTGKHRTKLLKLVDKLEALGYNRKHDTPLYYLCFIYMHPLTKIETLYTKCLKIVD